MAGVRDCAIFRLWGQSKVVYAMDDDLLGYLSESVVSSISTEILRGGTPAATATGRSRRHSGPSARRLAAVAASLR
jgi:hypothetical protein